MEQNSKEFKSDSYFTQEIRNPKRNYSLKSNSLKNQQFTSNSKLSKENLLASKPYLSKSTKKNKKNKLKEEKKEIKVISSMIYQENKLKNEIELLQKRHQKEISDIIKFELDKQLLQLKTNKEQEKYEKEYNNMNYKSLYNNNNILLSLIEKEKGKEALENSKEKNKIKNNDSKLKGKDIINNDKNIPPKPLKIIDEKNFHENYYLMDQAKKRQIYEMNQKLTQKKFEKKEKLNKIKSEQNAIKKRIEAERANKNIQKNNYDLSVRKNLIEIKIQIKDLFAYQNRQKINEVREEAIKMNRKMEQEKFDYIKKLRLSEEKDRISLYLDKIKKAYKEWN